MHLEMVIIFLLCLCELAVKADLNDNDQAIAEFNEFKKKDVNSLTDTNDDAENLNLEVKRQSQNNLKSAVDFFCNSFKWLNNPIINLLCDYGSSIINAVRNFCRRIGARREIEFVKELPEENEFQHQIQRRQVWINPAKELCKRFVLGRREVENAENLSTDTDTQISRREFGNN